MGLPRVPNDYPALKRWAITNSFGSICGWNFQELALEYRLKANDQKLRDRQKMTVEAITSFAIKPQGWSNDFASNRAGTFETTTTGTIQLKINLNRGGKIESG